MNTNYIDELNESQCAAVTYNDGPSLVIAGAGSGKTRVLTYKIAYLLEQENGYNPWNILALTFTNKAAREMKERIARQVGMERARYLWMGTFHSIFSRILRAEATFIGFTSQFTIYDTADSKSLLRSIIKEMGLDEKTYKPGVVQARISNAKNHLVTPTGMLPIKRLTKEIWLPRCLLSVISILVIGTDAVRRERWILMIYWYIPIFCFVTFQKCWHVIAISSVMYWWTSIRIRIMCSIALFCN